MPSQTLAQRERLQLIVQKPNGIAYQADQGQPLEVYRERSPWSMWGPVLTLAVILCATLLAVVYLWNTGAISLAEIDLATEQARLEHARLMGADEGWSTGQVTGLVAAILLGVVAVPSVAITCARR